MHSRKKEWDETTHEECMRHSEACSLFRVVLYIGVIMPYGISSHRGNAHNGTDT